MTLGRVVAVAALAALMTGCAAKGRCYKVSEYQKSEPSPEIAVPDGLKPIDDTQKLVIPEGERNTTATPKSEKCLDYPPRYFREAPEEQ